MSLTFEVKRFNDLDIYDLYKILRLRAEVFIMEQECLYQDIDDKDQKALHILGKKNGELVAYSRVFDKGDYFDKVSFGRVVIPEQQRKYGYGHDLIKATIQGVEENFDTSEILISAQTYLKRFYEKHGFKQVGEGYLEDGIPHIKMIR